jgi:hypothetical protein
MNRFRTRTLGLEPVSLMWAPGMTSRLRIPFTYCWYENHASNLTQSLIKFQVTCPDSQLVKIPYKELHFSIRAPELRAVFRSQRSPFHSVGDSSS